MANKKWRKEDVIRYAQELRSPFEQQPQDDRNKQIAETAQIADKIRRNLMKRKILQGNRNIPVRK